jgi:hypothetical protein
MMKSFLFTGRIEPIEQESGDARSAEAAVCYRLCCSP